ncbi:MAG: hypothetical protein ACE5MB_09530 [Anaerolineae bacterium]
MTGQRRKYASFLVRIWQEPREIAGHIPQWRGSIEHIQGEQKRYFKDTEALAEFIQEVLDELQGEAQGGRRYLA